MPKLINGLTFSSGKYLFDYITNLKIKKNNSNISSALIPHGHLTVTGNQIAKIALETPDESFPDQIIILATSHYKKSNILIDYKLKLETGYLDASKELAAKLKEGFEYYNIPLEEDYEIAQKEHSWRVFLSLFHHRALSLKRELKYCAILIGDGKKREEVIAKIIEKIRNNTPKNIQVLISGDLSHVGNQYEHQNFKSTNLEELLEEIKVFDQKRIQEILKHNYEDYSTNIKETSYCAREQVGIFLKLNDRDFLINDYQTNIFSENTSEQSIFSTAIIAAGYNNKNGILPCPKVRIIKDKNKIYLYHVCNNSILKLNFVYANLLNFLIENPKSKKKDIINYMEESDLFQKNKSHVFYDKLENFLKSNVLEYHTHTLKTKNEVNFKELVKDINIYENYDKIDANLIRKFWSISPEDLKDDPENYYIRYSSGSSNSENKRNNRLVSIYPKSVYWHRFWASDSINHSFVDYTILLNRSENLQIDAYDDKANIIESNNSVKICVSSNPYLVKDEVWKEVYQFISKLEKKVLIHSDPHFLNAFACFCKKVKLTLDNIFEVELSHSFAWDFMLKNISNAFHCKINIKLMSSELIFVTNTCVLGKEHLIEDNIDFSFEDFDDKRKVLIASTKDTKFRPLINYATYDVVKKVDCDCDQNSQAIQFRGRKKDLIKYQNSVFDYQDINLLLTELKSLRTFKIKFENNVFKIYLDFIDNTFFESQKENLSHKLAKIFDHFEIRHITHKPFEAGKFRPITIK